MEPRGWKFQSRGFFFVWKGVTLVTRLLLLFIQEFLLSLMTRLITEAAERCPTFWGWGMTAKARLRRHKVRA